MKQLQEIFKEAAEVKYPPDPVGRGDVNFIHEQRRKGFAAGMEFMYKVLGWRDAKKILPTANDTSDEFYNEVITVQVGVRRPQLMKYWEVKHCPFTKMWMPVVSVVNLTTLEKLLQEQLNKTK